MRLILVLSSFSATIFIAYVLGKMLSNGASFLVAFGLLCGLYTTFDQLHKWRIDRE